MLKITIKCVLTFNFIILFKIKLHTVCTEFFNNSHGVSSHDCHIVV